MSPGARLQPLALGGLTVVNDLSDPAQSPGMEDVLRWLLHSGHNADFKALLGQASRCRLIAIRPGNGWKVNESVALSKINAEWKRLPVDPAELGRLICGLGEMRARCSDDSMDDICARFQQTHKNIDVSIIFDAAVSVSKQSLSWDTQGRFWREAQGVSQLFNTAKLDWNSFQVAITLLRQPYQPICIGAFGLQFSALVSLTIDSHGLDRWIVQHPDNLALAAVANVVIDTLHDGRNKRLAYSMLKSRVPMLVCLAAASVILPRGRSAADGTVLECWESLTDAGIAPGDALWLVGFRLKEAAQEKYRLEQKVKSIQRNFPAIGSGQRVVSSGLNHSASQIISQKADLKDASSMLESIDVAVEEMLCQMSERWPASGLSSEQQAHFQNVVFDKPEIRYRLAATLRQGQDRNILLKLNIDEVKNFLGIADDLEKAFEKYFQPDMEEFVVKARWAAQSLILLYQADTRRGVGKRTSDVIHGLVEAAGPILEQPFIAARQPTRWQSALSRSACACMFAMTVAFEMPKERRNDVKYLTIKSIEHARKIFCADVSGENYADVLDYLARMAQYAVSFLPNSDKIRQQWVLEDNFPIFVRALMLWSAPHLAQQNEPLAFCLFRRVAELPLTRAAEDLYMSRLLSLLDIAIGSNWVAERYDQLPKIAEIWSEVYLLWDESTNGRWGGTAKTLINALSGDCDDRVALLSDQSFSRFYCRQIIAG